MLCTKRPLDPEFVHRLWQYNRTGLVDVNNNGIIDAADTLMSGIPVLLYQNAVLQGAANSGTTGDFAFTNILSTNYSVELDPTLLPPNWHMVIGQDPVSLSGCDVEGQADLLLHYQCQISTATVQLQTCPVIR